MHWLLRMKTKLLHAANEQVSKCWAALMDAHHEQLKAEEAHVSSGLEASTDRALVEKLGTYAQKYSL